MNKIDNRPIPYDIFTLEPSLFLRKMRALKKELNSLPIAADVLVIKVAILGGATTNILKDALEVFLKALGFAPSFYESEYNRYFEEAVYDNSNLLNFNPDIIYIHTTTLDIDSFPSANATKEDVDDLLNKQLDKYKLMWEKLKQIPVKYIFQNNFPLLPYRTLGNLEVSHHAGKTNFINKFNQTLLASLGEQKNVHLFDLSYIASTWGLTKWYDSSQWYSSKYPYSLEATIFVAKKFSLWLSSFFGKAKKCLVLDLDNTLWGGVIGDDGVQGILLGEDTPAGQAYCQFQSYLRELKNRGVILAICSKNDISNVQEGLNHPDSLLKIDDFASVQASWGPKTEGIKNIANELNIGLDSLVFVDDNPAERELIRLQLPMVAVANINDDVTNFIPTLDELFFFETPHLDKEDINKNFRYQQNKERELFSSQFSSYHDFLKSLKMQAEMGPFTPLYLERITQLFNKTNQFNLTMKRVTSLEVEDWMNSKKHITLYSKLQDQFGDNGLVSAMVGEIDNHQLNISMWVMSCRVFKRDLEFAMFNSLKEICLKQGITSIKGCYTPGPKNHIVKNLYQELGFNKTNDNEWILENVIPVMNFSEVMTIHTSLEN